MENKYLNIIDLVILVLSNARNNVIFYEISVFRLLIVVKFSFEYNLSSCSSNINRINLRIRQSMKYV